LSHNHLKMKRLLIEDLYKWKNKPKRKPLILEGTRQVGKTWLMKSFGEQAYTQTIYLNFESGTALRDLFKVDFNIPRIISTIEIEMGVKINAENTLLIFDEIQEVEKGLTALKYFYELAPQYHIIAAGSWLGISLQKNNSFPVGKVDFLHLYPLSFIEFLENTGEKNLGEQIIANNWALLEPFHAKLVSLTRLYYFVGGMPEAVLTYIESNNLQEVRQIQLKIIQGYENDFGKHAPAQIVPKIRLVWNAILSQLAKENKKFIYGQIKKGARAKEFEDAISWLVNAGLIIKICKVEKPSIPLKAYADFEVFKLFILDIGLLTAMADISPKTILEKNKILTEFKGALTEQFVCQQLKPLKDLYFWGAQNGTAELDFMVQDQNIIIPVEVKAEENLKAKSMKVYIEKYQPQKALRVAMVNYKIRDNNLINIPLYAVGEIFKAEN
jgi:uncharacterized protein